MRYGENPIQLQGCGKSYAGYEERMISSDLAVQLVVGRKGGVGEGEFASLAAIGSLDSKGRHC